MGKKSGGGWFSSVKKVFKSSSKDSPVTEKKVTDFHILGSSFPFFYIFSVFQIKVAEIAIL